MRRKWALPAAGCVLICALRVAAGVRTVALSGQVAPGTGGAQFLGFSNYVINDAGQVAFMSNLFGAGVDPNNATGIWAEGGNGLALVARTHSAAPGTGGAAFHQLQSGADEMRFSDAGSAAFRGQTEAPIGVTGPWGVWDGAPGSLQAVMYGPDQVPDTVTGTQWRFPGPVAQDHAGHVIFQSTLDPTSAGVNAANDSGVWTDVSGSLHLLARAGSPAAGVSGGAYQVFDSPSINDHGQYAIAGTYQTNVQSSVGALWSGSGGALALRYAGGSAAPGTGGKAFASFQTPMMNDQGGMAFRGILSSVDPAVSRGVWAEANGSLELAALQGDPAPGTTGLRYHQLNNFAFSTSGRVVIQGTAWNGSGNDFYGVWGGQPGQMQAVALTGQHAPGMAAGVNFDFFTQSTDVNANGLLVFCAYLQNASGSGIWADDGAGGGPQPVVLPGEPLLVGPGDARTVSVVDLLESASGDATGYGRSINDAGQIVFHANFTDGSNGIFVFAVPEPASLVFCIATTAMVLRRRSKVKKVPADSAKRI